MNHFHHSIPPSTHTAGWTIIFHSYALCTRNQRFRGAALALTKPVSLWYRHTCYAIHSAGLNAAIYIVHVCAIDFRSTADKPISSEQLFRKVLLSSKGWTGMWCKREEEEGMTLVSSAKLSGVHLLFQPLPWHYFLITPKRLLAAEISQHLWSDPLNLEFTSPCSDSFSHSSLLCH